MATVRFLTSVSMVLAGFFNMAAYSTVGVDHATQRLGTAPSWLLPVLLQAILVLCPTPASAQTFGVRAGASIDPDQFVFGGHFESKPLVDRLRFRPNVEVGVGDGATLLAFNFEFAYHFPSRQAWSVYAGGGPALNLLFTEGEDHTGGGFNFLLGIQHRRGLFGEIKLGAIDSADFKITVGYVFR